MTVTSNKSVYTKIEKSKKEGVTGIVSSQIGNRKGMISISRDLILNAELNTLREIFTNFFPIDADRNHKETFWDHIKYYGISPFFDEVEGSNSFPEYEIVLKMDSNGDVKFDKMNKL